MCSPAAYRPVPVAVKETRTNAWIRLPGTRETVTAVPTVPAPAEATASTASTASGRLLRLLRLHPGREISVPAAAALADLPGAHARDLLDALAGEGVLEQPARGRYRLTGPMHGHGADQVSSPDGDDPDRIAAVRRVLAWYLGTADNARRILCPERVTMCLALLDAPCAPLTFGSAEEARRWCETERLNLIAAARLAADEGHHDIAWRLPLALWTFFFLHSPWTDWIDALRTGLDSARAARAVRDDRDDRDDRDAAYALGGLGYASQNRWRFEESVSFFVAARATFVRIGDRGGEAWALHGLGYACRRLQRFDEAIGHHRRSLALTGEVGDRRMEGWAWCALGYAHAGLSQFTGALDHFQQARVIAQETERRAEGWALHGIGYAQQGLHQLEPAISHYRDALDIFSEIGDRAGQGEALYNLGRAHLGSGRPDAARGVWVKALALFEDLQSPQTTGVLARLRSLDSGRPSEPPDSATSVPSP